MRALAVDDKEKAGWRAIQAGGMYNLRNQAVEVLACAERTSAHWEGGLYNRQEIASGLRAFAYELQKDYPAAIIAYRNVLGFASPESQAASLALNLLANVERKNKDYLAAERDYREALRIAKIVKYQEGVAYMTGNLANLALDREQWAEAESLAREALALAEKVGRQELIASDCHRLATALLKQKRATDEALTLARRAVEIFTRLRMQDLHSAQETLAEIEKAIHE